MNKQVQKIYDWLIEAKEQATIAKRPFEADSPNRIPYYNGKIDLCVNLIAFIKNELSDDTEEV